MSGRLLGVATQIMMIAVIVSIALLFVGVAALVLVHACIVGRAFRRALSTMTRGDRSEGVGEGLSPADLETIPRFEFMGAATPVMADCAVCLESFQLGDLCRMMPLCRHSFHAMCVDSWLTKTPACPICRTCVYSHKAENGLHGSVGIELGSTGSNSSLLDASNS